MKKETSEIIKTFVVVLGVVFVMIAFGTKLGRAEKSVETLCETVKSMHDRQQVIVVEQANIKQQQAYQKGVVNTKLENLEKGIMRIESIVSQWEPE